MQKIYLGIDECKGRNEQEGSFIVACLSKNPNEIIERSLIKRRDLDPGVLSTDFTYMHLTRHENPHSPEVLMYLFHETARKMQGKTKGIVLIDGEMSSWKREYSAAVESHPLISELIFVKKGDTKIPLINKADHLANMLYTIYQNKPKNAERLERIRRLFPNLEKKLESCKID